MVEQSRWERRSIEAAFLLLQGLQGLQHEASPESV